MSTQNFFHVISITSPAFVLIALGYTVVKANWLQSQGIQALGWFVVHIGLPAAIFKALSTRRFQDILHIDYLLIYGLGSLIAFFALFLIARLYLGKSLTEGAFFGLGASMSNSLMIGYPIIFQLFGPAVLIPYALTLVIENLLILPLSLALADIGTEKNTHFLRAFSRSIPKLLKNPIIIAIILGVISSAASIELPQVANRVIDSLSMTVAGLAQFTIGAILAGGAIKAISTDTLMIVIGKLLLHPAAILLMLFLMPPINPLFQSTAIILACMPMFSIYAVLGQNYDLGELCSAVLLPATIISFATITLAIFLLEEYKIPDQAPLANDQHTYQ